MSVTETINAVLGLVAGVGIFLVACNILSARMQSFGGKKLKALFSRAEKSKLVGLGVGAAATAAVQSSGATMIMIIGFVGGGVMSLNQAAAVIFGANIGTTITGQFVALGLFGGTISVSAVFGAVTGVGAFVSALARSEKVKRIGETVAAFGMIFVGLSIMGGAMNSFSAPGEVGKVIAAIDSPVVLVLAGAVFTALMQSSSVMTTIVITMAASGLITVDQGIYITIGANIGTCATMFIVGLASGASAKRCAFIQLAFNLFGAAVFLAVGLVLRISGTDYDAILCAVVPSAPQLRLAIFHTAFNMITALILLPFTERIARTATRVVADKPNSRDAHKA